MQTQGNQMFVANTRQVNLDLLRILACVMVITQHVAGTLYYAYFGRGSWWLACNFFEVIVRVDVPLFFMLSGNLFLNRERPVPYPRLLRKNILKLIVVYLVWNIFYAYTAGGAADVNSLESLHIFLYRAIVDTKYHMWFLPTMLSIYTIVPVLYAALNGEEAKKGRLMEYVIGMFLVFNILTQTISAIGRPDSILLTTLGQIFYVFGGYCGYFILGAYIARLDLSGYKTRCVLLAYVAVVFVHFGLSTAHAYHNQRASEFLFDSFSLPVFLEAVLLFILFQKMSEVRFPVWAEKVSCEVANCTLGIYVLHEFMLETIGDRAQGLLLQNHHTVISVSVTVAAVFVCSLVLVWMLRKIPFVRSWLV